VQCSWPGGLHFEYLPQELFMSNFTMQADMTFVKGGGGGGFVFHASSHENRQYSFHVSPDGTYDLRNQTQILTSGSSRAVKRGFNHTNQLTIIAQKHTIYAYINGQFITQVDDNTANYGMVGGMAY